MAVSHALELSLNECRAGADFSNVSQGVQEVCLAEVARRLEVEEEEAHLLVACSAEEEDQVRAANERRFECDCA